MKKFLIVTLAFVVALSCLCSCKDNGNKPAISPSAGEYGAFEELYPKLSFEVKDSDGNVTEQMYGLYRDEEFKTIVGTKDIYFSAETGKMNQYIVTIGLIAVERTITYREDNDGNSFLTEMHYDVDGNITRGTSDNNFTGSDGEKIRELAEQEYYSDGVTVKSLTVSTYKDDVLQETTVRKYDEDGNMTSEEIS